MLNKKKYKKVEYYITVVYFLYWKKVLPIQADDWYNQSHHNLDFSIKIYSKKPQREPSPWS